MGLSEIKARFRGYRRHMEETEEARVVEHNRNVSELFTSTSWVRAFSALAVLQNMRLYEKRVNDTVAAIVSRARYALDHPSLLYRSESVLSEETVFPSPFPRSS